MQRCRGLNGELVTGHMCGRGVDDALQRRLPATIVQTWDGVNEVAVHRLEARSTHLADSSQHAMGDVTTAEEREHVGLRAWRSETDPVEAARPPARGAFLRGARRV